MVYNLTRPVTATALNSVPTARYGRVSVPYEVPLEEVYENNLRGLRKQRKSVNKSYEKTLSELAALDAVCGGMRDMDAWAKGFLTLEQPLPCVSTLRHAFREKRVINIAEFVYQNPPQDYDELFEEGQTFRIEHDWYKAINKADQFNDGSFRLPFETCLFEFQISKRPVVVICLNYSSAGHENSVVMQLAVYGMVGWILSAHIYQHDGGRWGVLEAGGSKNYDELDRLVEVVGNQIRAACIALDAEVAVTTPARMPHDGAGKPAGELSEYEAYTISLANRTRVEALPGHGEPKGIRRLHFRRGHWRHYAESKTWVRWCLCGNAELGFIDKQYRL